MAASATHPIGTSAAASGEALLTAGMGIEVRLAGTAMSWPRGSDKRGGQDWQWLLETHGEEAEIK